MTRYYLILHPKDDRLKREIPIKATTIEQARQSAIAYFQKNGLSMGDSIGIKDNGKGVGTVVCKYNWPKPSDYTYDTPNGILCLKSDGTVRNKD